jgi:hypothetical protein
MSKRNIGSRILRALRRSPSGLSCSQMCRALNGKPLSYCYNCRDYGNMWKRKRGILKEPDCEIRKGSVWYRLQQLLKEGLVWAQREQRKDKFMSRGWDWMRIYYEARGA